MMMLLHELELSAVPIGRFVPNTACPGWMFRSQYVPCLDHVGWTFCTQWFGSFAPKVEMFCTKGMVVSILPWVIFSYFRRLCSTSLKGIREILSPLVPMSKLRTYLWSATPLPSAACNVTTRIGDRMYMCWMFRVFCSKQKVICLKLCL